MQPKVYRDPHRGRLILVAMVVAALVLGLIVAGVLALHRTTQSGGFTGTIVGKEFRPAPAREITVGQGGLSAQDVAGDYIFQVRAPGKTNIFNVWVDKRDFESKKEGDEFYVIPVP